MSDLSNLAIAASVLQDSDKLSKRSYYAILNEAVKLQELRLRRKLTKKEVAEVEANLLAKTEKEKLKKVSLQLININFFRN